MSTYIAPIRDMQFVLNEIAGLEEGELYDVASVAAVMKPLPEGYNVADYFRNERYLGADEAGVEISL